MFNLLSLDSISCKIVTNLCVIVIGKVTEPISVCIVCTVDLWPWRVGGRAGQMRMVHGRALLAEIARRIDGRSKSAKSYCQFVASSFAHHSSIPALSCCICFDVNVA